MEFLILGSGNLLISCDNVPFDIPMLQDIKDECGGNDCRALSDLLEQTGWQPNGQLYQVFPEDVGAPTDAPMLSNDADYNGDGVRTVYGDVWYYSDYMVKNWLGELIEHGQVIFTKALDIPA